MIRTFEVFSFNFLENKLNWKTLKPPEVTNERVKGFAKAEWHLQTLLANLKVNLQMYTVPWSSCGDVTAFTHLLNTAVVVIIPSSDLKTHTFQ